MPRGAGSIVVLSKTLYNRYIQDRTKEEEDDIFGRKANLNSINRAIASRGLQNDGEFVFGIMCLSDQLLFDQVDLGMVKTQKDFNANVNSILNMINDVRYYPTLYSNYIVSRKNIEDYYGRKCSLWLINNAIIDRGFSVRGISIEESLGIREFVINIMAMSDELLFKAVEQKEVNSQTEFDFNVNSILDYVNEGNLFSSRNVLLEDGFVKIKEDEKLLKSGTSGVRGIAICPRCKKDNIIIYTKQKCKGDEGETQFNTCTDCNNKWTVN